MCLAFPLVVTSGCPSLSSLTGWERKDPLCLCSPLQVEKEKLKTIVYVGVNCLVALSAGNSSCVNLCLHKLVEDSCPDILLLNENQKQRKGRTFVPVANLCWGLLMSHQLTSMLGYLYRWWYKEKCTSSLNIPLGWAGNYFAGLSQNNQKSYLLHRKQIIGNVIRSAQLPISWLCFFFWQQIALLCCTYKEGKSLGWAFFSSLSSSQVVSPSCRRQKGSADL